MWEEQKNKIKNEKLFEKENFVKDFLGLSDEILCTEECCLVHFYNKIDDSLSSITFDEFEFTSNEINTGIESSCTRHHKQFNAIILHNLSIIDYTDNDNKKIEKQEKLDMPFFSFSTFYLKFIKCINFTNNRKTIVNADTTIFMNVLRYNYIDKTIKSFLQKLVCDPLLYDALDKNKVIIIMLYSYLYSERHNLEIKKQLYEKIKNNIFLLKSNVKFSVTYTKIYELDKYLLDCKEFEDLYDESHFLNFYYQNYMSKSNIEKKVFLAFIERLNSVLHNIDISYLLSFLKRVFSTSYCSIFNNR